MDEFERIYRTYFKDVYLYVRSISQNDDIAEEITAETFFKAMKSLKQFKVSCIAKEIPKKTGVRFFGHLFFQLFYMLIFIIHFIFVQSVLPNNSLLYFYKTSFYNLKIQHTLLFLPSIYNILYFKSL